MADGKWISGLHEDMPVVKAARQVLQLRLKTVIDRLPQALFESARDREHVHQLRVGTRRAGAALRIFASLLPDRAVRKVRRALRQVRRAAGEARDWDVFLQQQSEREGTSDVAQHPGLDLLIGLAHGQRISAQTRLQEATRDVELEPLLEEVLSCLRADHASEPELSLGQLAVRQLGDLLEELHRAASQDLSDYEHLHQVRIVGKHLRYAMEVFDNCFDATFRDLYYAPVEKMQEILGLANDSFVAIGRLQCIRDWVATSQPDTWERYRPGIEGLISFHKERLPQQREAFDRWWTDWQTRVAEFAWMLHRKGYALNAGK